MNKLLADLLTRFGMGINGMVSSNVMFAKTLEKYLGITDYIIKPNTDDRMKFIINYGGETFVLDYTIKHNVIKNLEIYLADKK